MKKILVVLTILLLAAPVWAATWNQVTGGIAVGVTTNNSSGMATLALNAADTWLAMSFVADSTKTLSKIKMQISANNGTQSNITITATLYADTGAGIPDSGGSALDGPRSVTNQASGYIEWTGWTYEVTAGTQYWIVFKNTAASPGTDYPTMKFGTANSLPLTQVGNRTGWGWGKVGTVNAGGAWATAALASTVGLRLEFSDGTFAGTPILNHAIGNAKAYGTNVVGAKFTTPSTVTLKIKGIGFMLRKTGSPTGNLSAKMYIGSGTAVSTAVVPAGITSTAALFVLPFASVQTVNPSSVVRIVLKNSAADDTSNYYTVYEYTIPDNADSKALFPMGWQNTYTADDSGSPSWTDTDTLVPFMWVVLDSDAYFGTPAAGGASAYAY